MAEKDFAHLIRRIEPKLTEFPNEVSVFRYVVEKPFDINQITIGIEESRFKSGLDFGIVEPRLSSSKPIWDKDSKKTVRTLWAKIGERDHMIIDDDGNADYIELSRIRVAGGVVEFLDGGEHTDIVIFSGANIKNDLLFFLRRNFGFISPQPQLLSSEQIRKIFDRYWRKMKRIDLDPSNDVNWGGSREIIVAGPRRDFIDVEARQLRAIKENRQLIIEGFKSVEQEGVHGMIQKVNVQFELASDTFKLYVYDLALVEAAKFHAEEVLYDLASKVYFKVIEDHRWSGFSNPEFVQLSLLDVPTE